jgi:hypothetical protein
MRREADCGLKACMHAAALAVRRALSQRNGGCRSHQSSARRTALVSAAGRFRHLAIQRANVLLVNDLGHVILHLLVITAGCSRRARHRSTVERISAGNYSASQSATRSARCLARSQQRVVLMEQSCENV